MISPEISSRAPTRAPQACYRLSAGGLETALVRRRIRIVHIATLLIMAARGQPM